MATHADTLDTQARLLRGHVTAGAADLTGAQLKKLCDYYGLKYGARESKHKLQTDLSAPIAPAPVVAATNPEAARGARWKPLDANQARKLGKSEVAVAWALFEDCSNKLALTAPGLAAAGNGSYERKAEVAPLDRPSETGSPSAIGSPGATGDCGGDVDAFRRAVALVKDVEVAALMMALRPFVACGAFCAKQVVPAAAAAVTIPGELSVGPGELSVVPGEAVVREKVEGLAALHDSGTGGPRHAAAECSPVGGLGATPV